MDCVEARSLLVQGVRPGSNDPQRAKLGFHLAGCTECSAYRVSLDAAAMPAARALDMASRQGFHTRAAGREKITVRAAIEQRFAPEEITPEDTGDQGKRPLRLRMWIGSAIAAIVLLAVVYVGRAAWNVHNDLGAMVITPVVVTGTVTTTGDVTGVPVMLAGTTTQTETVTVATTSSSEPKPSEPKPNAPKPTATITPTPTKTLIPSPTALPPPAGGPVNILLLGNDRRPGEVGIPRTDAIMLVHIDPNAPRISALSFPRDLWVEIPGFGSSRINAAYVWGEAAASGGGINLTKATVSKLTGVTIDYVIMVDFEGFINLIDTIGGITVDVEKDLYDPQFPTMDYGYAEVHFTPGATHMDGVTALTYSRIRHPDSDFARLTRQQAVLAGIARRIRERGDLVNLATADQLTASMREFVQTDMPQDRILGLLWVLRDTPMEKTGRYTLSGDMVTQGIGSDQYALSVDPQTMKTLVKQWLGQ